MHAEQLIQTAKPALVRILLFVSMLMLYVPFNPLLPAASLDPSWALGMNELASRHASFGRDVIFTFGPLAAVYTTYFHPATDEMVILVSVLLALAVTGCWILILRRCSPWYWLCISLLCWVTINSRDALLFALPVLASVATAFWVQDPASAGGGKQGEGIRFLPPAILMFAWAMTGVLPLIKGTMFVGAVALVALTVVFLALAGHRGMAVLTLVLPPLVSAGVWLWIGQSLDALPWFVRSTSEIIKGYTEAMAYGLVKPRHFIQVILFVMVAGMLVRQAAVFGSKRSSITALYWVAVLSVSLFLSFKASFVRHDEGHAIIAMNIAVILLCVAFARMELPEGGRWRWLIAGALLWFSVMDGFREWSLAQHLPHWWSAQRASIGALFDRLARPSAIPSAFHTGFARIREQYPIPRLEGTLDVYPTNHAVALASDVSWSPRPILQSYSAYTQELARLNRDHLMGMRAPDWIWFNVEPIDGRLASQEDGISWPVLLSDYEPAQRVQGGVLLKRRLRAGQTSVSPPGRVLLQRRVMMGERVELPRGAGPMTLSVQVQRNMLGGLLQTVFKARSLALEVELESGETRRWRVVSGMLADGVILSPLVENTDEFIMLYGDQSLLSDKQVRALRLIESDRGPGHWQKDYELVIRDAPSVGKQVSVSSQIMRVQSPVALTLPFTKKAFPCRGHIDFINALKQDGQLVSRAPILRVRGWVADVVGEDDASRRGEPFLLLEGGQRSWILHLQPERRPDVAAHLGATKGVDSGWAVLGDIRPIQGAFTLSIAYEDAGVIHTCTNLTQTLWRP